MASYLDLEGLSYFWEKVSPEMREKMGFYSDTEENWNRQVTLTSEKDMLYIYTDHKVIQNGDGTTTQIPGFKLGDGRAYLIDMPFLNVDERTFMAHVNDDTAHITAAEREFWNNKVRCLILPADNENIIFTTN